VALKTSSPFTATFKTRPKLMLKVRQEYKHTLRRRNRTMSMTNNEVIEWRESFMEAFSAAASSSSTLDVMGTHSYEHSPQTPVFHSEKT
jgi:recombinational DNA repair ATPase RecF